MKRGVWLILAALAVISATAPFHYMPEPVGVIESAPPAGPTPPPAVRVSHEFVTVEIRPRTSLAANRPGAKPSRPAGAPKTATHDPAPTVRRGSRDRNLLERAGRVLIGDGKYRPEPFPRVR
jgi:hypothetical protein